MVAGGWGHDVAYRQAERRCQHERKDKACHQRQVDRESRRSAVKQISTQRAPLPFHCAEEVLKEACGKERRQRKAWEGVANPAN